MLTQWSVYQILGKLMTSYDGTSCVCIKARNKMLMIAGNRSFLPLSGRTNRKLGVECHLRESGEKSKLELDSYDKAM